MRIAVTRPVEDAVKLSQGLVAQGHEVWAAPLMDIEFLPPPDVSLRAWQAILITSANALKALEQHPQLRAFLHVTCCCVGPASASAAREMGFVDIRVAGGGLLELQALVRRELVPEKGPLLYLSGEQISGDLVGDLGQFGFETLRIMLYRAKPTSHLPQELIEQIAQGRLDGVVLYSPRSARIWNALLSAQGQSVSGGAIVHYCLSANVAANLPLGALVKIAQYPEDAAMLALTALAQEADS